MISRFERFVYSLWRINRCILRIERDEMAKHGLNGTHAQYLLALARSPNGLTISQLCESCDKDKAAVSRAISHLEENGLTVRHCSGASAYRAPIRLTEKGNDIAHSIGEAAKTAVEIAGKGLTDENRKIFYASMELIASNLVNICEEGLPQKGVHHK